MAILYPGAQDTFTTRTAGDTISESHINDLQDVVELLEKRLGITGDELIIGGTKMLIYADVSPANWTIDNAMDDKLVFVTKGSTAGGQTGGGAHSTGTWTVSGISVADHNHQWYEYTGHDDQVYQSDGSTAIEIPYVWRAHSTALPVYHDQDVYSTDQDLYTKDASCVISSDGAWRPAAYCWICCSKEAYPTT